MNWLERLHRAPNRIPLGDGVAELLSWAHVPHLPNNVPHRHTYFEVCQVGSYGSGRFIVQGKEHPIHPGDLFIARPGVIHQIVNTEFSLMELYWVCFQWLPDTGKEGEIGHLMRTFAESSVAVVPDEAGRIASLWAALRSVAESPYYAGYELQAASSITSLLLAIAQAGAGPEAFSPTETARPEEEHAVARMAIRYIHDNLERPLPLPEIADHVFLSPRHLTRLFKTYAGVSPATYITRARLDRAQGLLLHTDQPIKEIATAVGYEDVHYFTRLFTRHFQRPPGSFRRQGGGPDVSKVQKIGALV